MMFKDPIFWLALVGILLFTGYMLRADIVELKNGYEIEAPIVLDKHGYFGDPDETFEAVPEGKVRLKYENGHMDIPAKEIKKLKRVEP